ncbi:unnamed protein product [Staurois parvus]|uniref:Uncharacterized protein n=1 Tax=Staurois parvus TaxID=386267 RepID=A0ABN9G4A2_9NEOB|nr:unnamed protein product [Staurois parvus]
MQSVTSLAHVFYRDGIPVLSLQSSVLWKGLRSAVIGVALCPSDTADHRSTERAEDVGSVM